MSTTDWNEIHLAEEPAADLLERLGYTFVPADELGLTGTIWHA